MCATCSPIRPHFTLCWLPDLHFWLTRINHWPALVATTLLLIGSAYSIYQFHFNPRYQADDFRAAVAFIDNHWQPGDAIITNAGYIYTAATYYTGPTYAGTPTAGPLPFTWNDRANCCYYKPARWAATNTWGGVIRFPIFMRCRLPTQFRLWSNWLIDFPRLWLLRAYDTVTDPNGLIRGLAGRECNPAGR